MKKMDASKEVELDGAHPAIVEPLAEVLEKPSIRVFNTSLVKGRLSADWFTSTVISVHESGDGDDCGS